MYHDSQPEHFYTNQYNLIITKSIFHTIFIYYVCVTNLSNSSLLKNSHKFCSMYNINIRKNAKTDIVVSHCIFMTFYNRKNVCILPKFNNTVLLKIQSIEKLQILRIFSIDILSYFVYNYLCVILQPQ